MKANLRLLILAIILFPHFTTAQQIYTFSGTGVPGYSGDGGFKSGAQFNGPASVVIDNSNNLFIADQGNNVIRRITPQGTIRTFAGNGTAGYNGDGIAATAAALQAPAGLATDAAGNVYVADRGNNRLRKIAASGTITTIAGTGIAGYNGNGGAATAAKLNAPAGVAIDASGNIYISDNGNNVIRRINASGTITTYAGSTAGYAGDGGQATAAQLNSPLGITIDESGNLLIADYANNVIRKVTTAHIISTIAGNGSAGNNGDGAAATAARLNGPVSVKTDGAGSIFITDQGNNRVRRINASGTISNKAGTGTAGYAGDGGSAVAGMLSMPGGIAVDAAGNVFIADYGNNVVRLVTSNTSPTFVQGTDQTMTVCTSGAQSLSSMLAFTDPDNGQTESWTLTSAPAHGTITGFPSTSTSTGSTVTPTGVTYTPDYGYLGPDAFTITLYDGIGTSITNVSINVSQPPVMNQPASQTLCAGANTATVTFTGSTGSTYSWTNNNTATGLAASGTGNIDAFMATDTDAIAASSTITVTPAANGCTGVSKTFTITVKPLPVLYQPEDQTQCADWFASPYTFMSNMAGTTYTWTNSNTSIGLGASGNGDIDSFMTINPTMAARIGTINVTPAANGCTGETKMFTIIVNPRPVAGAVADKAYCTGATTIPVNFTANIPGCTYHWTNSQPAIGLPFEGDGNIDAFVAVNSTPDPIVAIIGVVASTTEGCPGLTEFFNITVSPVPHLIDLFDQFACAGETMPSIPIHSSIAGTQISWTNSNTAIGLAASGTGNIPPFTATNTTNIPITGIITVSPMANGCNGSATSFSIAVNPAPDVAPVANKVFCNGAATPAIAFNGSLFGTTYSWTNDNTSIGLAASGTGDIPSFTAVNMATGNAVANVSIVPSANGCTGTTKTFTITVRDGSITAVLPDQIACSGNTTAPVILPAGSTWTNDNTAIGAAAGGTGNIPSFVASNTGTAPTSGLFTVNYVGGCTGTGQFTFSVNPIPAMATPADQQVCSGAQTAIVNFTGNVSGTAFNWTNSNPAVGLVANGTGNIPSFVTINSGNTPAVAAITVTPSASGCNGVAHTFYITANPLPELSGTLTPADVCDNTRFSYVPVSTVSGTLFYWSRDAVTGIINAPAFGTGDPAEMLTNNTMNPLAVTYVYTLTAGSCTNTQNVVVMVKPTPVLTSATQAPAICDGSLFSYVPASNNVNATFRWERPFVAGISTPATTGTGNPNEVLNNITTWDIPVTYIYNVGANGCSSIQNVVVLTHPTPVLTTNLTALNCSKTAFRYDPACATTNVQYAWTRPAVNNILPATANGTGSINETLTNTSKASIDVTYSYVLTAAGCSHLQNLKLTVAPGATVPAITTTLANSGTLCANTMAGNFSVATAPPAGTHFTWSADNAVIASTGPTGQYALINFPNPGAAVITVTSDAEGGCSGAATYTVTVSNNRADAPADVVYTNNQFIALQNQEDGYQWGYDDLSTLNAVTIPGALNQNYYNANPQFGSKDYWVLIAHNGCTQKSYYQPLQAAAAGPTNDIKFYPNPANAKINVDITNPVAGNVQIAILNMTGQKIKTVYAPDSKTAIDVSDLAPGSYMINCYRDGNKIAGSKFLKN